MTNAGAPDALAIFESALGSMFNEPIFAHGDPGSYFIYVPTHEKYKLRLMLPRVDAHCVQLMSHYVWNSAIVMAGMIEQGLISVENKTVIEFGAGAGLPSIVAALNGASCVLTTDYDDDKIITAIQQNFQSNVKEIKATRWQVAGHVWGQDVEALKSRLPTEPQDRIILLADTLWIESQHTQLLESIQAVSNPFTHVYIVAGLHTGKAILDQFLNLASQKGWKAEILGVVFVPLACVAENEEWMVSGKDWKEAIEQASCNIHVQVPLTDVSDRKRLVYLYKLSLE